MRATRNASRTLVGIALLAGALSVGPRVGADDYGDDSPSDFEARALIEEQFPGLRLEQLRELAARNGFLRIRGAAHLSGRIFAQGFHVEAGAAVTIEPGTSIYSDGDIVIDSPIVPPPKPPKQVGSPKKAQAGGAIGGNGAASQGFTLACGPANGLNLTISQPIQVGDGDDGKDVDVVGASGQGGDGGDGGSVFLLCPKGTITISANVVPGRGGDGGHAGVTGADGAPSGPGQSVNAACGGKGGTSGNVTINANTVVFTMDAVNTTMAAGRIALRPGGSGGYGSATGGKGGDAIACGADGGNGGSAKAIGGAAGKATKALVQCKVLQPSNFDAHDIASFDENESPDGGEAVAEGGAGGDGFDCPPDIEDPCPDVGDDGGSGGNGGKATATGGAGGSGGQVGGGTGALNKRKQSGAESPPGDGGDATATGGAGGFATDGEDAQDPGGGGGGGGGGPATASGGGGGDSQLGRKDSQLPGNGQGPLIGGDGGDATATAGAGADGGDGGSCCDNPGGGGAGGGGGGSPGNPVARKGKGGLGFVQGADGKQTTVPGTDGLDGIDGGDCPSFVTDGLTMTSTLPKSTFVNQNTAIGIAFFNTGATALQLHIEICCDGKKLFAYDVTVPAATAAGPGVNAFAGGTLFITSPHSGHHISIMVNGKTVKVHILRVLAR